MSKIVETVKKEMIEICNKKKEEKNFDDWNNHIKIVYQHAHNLALERNA